MMAHRLALTVKKKKTVPFVVFPITIYKLQIEN